MSLLRSAFAGASHTLSSYSYGTLRTLTTSRATMAQPQPDKDPQLGDYPELPYVSLQTRKHSPKWWDPIEKKNFGETFHEQQDVLSVWAPDVHATSGSSALRQLLVAATVGVLFCTTLYYVKPEKPAVPRTYPRGGLAAELGGAHAAARSDNEDEE